MHAAVAEALAFGAEGVEVPAVDEYEPRVVPAEQSAPGEGELVSVGVCVRVEAVPDRLGVDHGANRSYLELRAHEVVGRYAFVFIVEPERLTEDVGVALVDGAVSRVGQDESAVDAPGRDQPDVQRLDHAGEAGGLAGIGRAVASGEALRPEPGADRDEVEETEGASGAIAHREVGHAVHQLVCDDVEDGERLLARPVGPPAVHEHAVAFGAQRWLREGGIRALEVHDGNGASVRAVDAFPAVPRGEVVVGPAGVGMGVDDGLVVPLVVRVGCVVVRGPDRLPGRQVLDQVVGDEPQEALEVEPNIQRDQLRRPQPVVRLEAPVGLRRAELPVVPQRVRTCPDGRLFPDGVRTVQNPAVGGVGEVEVSVAHRDVVGQCVRAVRQGKNSEQRLPAGEDLSAVHLFQQRGDLRSGQRRRDVHVDTLVQRAEQRHGDAGGVELPGHAAPEYRNTGEVLREILVRPPLQRGVAEARHDDELAGPRQAVDRRVPLPQFVEALRVSGCDGECGRFGERGRFLRCRVLSRGHERGPEEGRGEAGSSSVRHFLQLPSVMWVLAITVRRRVVPGGRPAEHCRRERGRTPPGE